MTLNEAAVLADKLSPAVIQRMREWASDCQWVDGDDLEEYTDAQIVAGVAQHYDGGLGEFMKDAEPFNVAGSCKPKLVAICLCALCGKHFNDAGHLERAVVHTLVDQGVTIAEAICRDCAKEES